MSDASSRRIKFAYLHTTWNAEQHPIGELTHNGKKVTAENYAGGMHGNLFCPGCYERLTRVPRAKLFFSNGRRACFSHLGSGSHVPCDLRSTRPEGKRYLTEEEARKAIADEELVVVSAFLSEPIGPANAAGIYDQTPVEDSSGPETEIPISRHSGKTFRLPTRISTIEALCRRFDVNLYRYFVLPGSSHAERLIDALADVRTVDSTTAVPRLYFGRILSSLNAGRTPKPSYLRMTKLACHPDVKDFYIKVVDSLQTKKGIGDKSQGRHILFWGMISMNGIGLCAEKLEWGQFALLPQMYEQMLPMRDA
jgi:hypothetical protein